MSTLMGEHAPRPPYMYVSVDTTELETRYKIPGAALCHTKSHISVLEYCISIL